MPIVEMNNSDVGVMQYLRSVIGPNRYHIHKKSVENHKTMYQLRVPTNVQKWLLEEISPYLKIKKRQAEIVMDFIELLNHKEHGKEDANLEDRERLYREVHDINHRGVGSKRCTF